MNEQQLALKYKPTLYFDKAEPFDIKGMGVTVFHEPGKSPSFRRTIEFDPETVEFAIEYAVYFDYDIQHLYDLEHIWIFVSRNGDVVDAEASFHGKYLKALALNCGETISGQHVELYCQPGKHAFLPQGNLFRLIPDWNSSCNRFAGSDGLLIADMFEKELSATPGLNNKIEKYIKTNFSFSPTLQFESKDLDDALFMPWKALKQIVPGRIEHEIMRINDSRQ